MNRVTFHSEIPTFTLKNKTKIRTWLHQIVAERGGRIGFVHYIFCDDAYLLKINQEYLKHNTLTDIITFRYQEHPYPIESDIYISTERVSENAAQFGVVFEEELRRVMVHGVLHLLGFKDKTTVDKEKMRKEEEVCLGNY